MSNNVFQVKLSYKLLQCNLSESESTLSRTSTSRCHYLTEKPGYRSLYFPVNVYDNMTRMHMNTTSR